MKLKLLGSKVRLEIIVLCVILGILIGSTMLCSCSKEGFHNSAPVGGDLNQYDFSKHGVKHNKGSVQNQPKNPMMPGQNIFGQIINLHQNAVIIPVLAAIMVVLV